MQGKPIVVGGSPESRGVVAAASYEARKYGIHSALPMKTAVKMCNSLVRISPRFTRYRKISSQIMSIFREVTCLVEPLSLDEAYLDISGLECPEQIATDLRLRIKELTGLSITIGGGVSKTIAKIASQLGKPNGLLLIAPGDETEFLFPLDISNINGVGPKTENVLKLHGLNTIGDLAFSDAEWLKITLGSKGLELKTKALGMDCDPVRPHRPSKSIGAETTLSKDTNNIPEIRDILRDLSDRVSMNLLKSGLKGRTVRLKIRLADFTTFSRQMTLALPTRKRDVIHHEAMKLFVAEHANTRKFRLLGVSVSNFSETYQLSLFDNIDI